MTFLRLKEWFKGQGHIHICLKCTFSVEAYQLVVRCRRLSNFVVFDNDVASDCAGNATVPVANCSEQQSYAHRKADMKFSDFVGYMKEQSSTDDTETDSEKEKSVLYLKDWHCQRHVRCSSCVCTVLGTLHIGFVAHTLSI